MRETSTFANFIYSLIKRHLIGFEYELPQNILMISQLCNRNILTNCCFIVNGLLILFRILGLILKKETNINVN